MSPKKDCLTIFMFLFSYSILLSILFYIYSLLFVNLNLRLTENLTEKELLCSLHTNVAEHCGFAPFYVSIQRFKKPLWNSICSLFQTSYEKGDWPSFSPILSWNSQRSTPGAPLWIWLTSKGHYYRPSNDSNSSLPLMTTILFQTYFPDSVMAAMQ